jgi:hypothetical protein
MKIIEKSSAKISMSELFATPIVIKKLFADYEADAILEATLKQYNCNQNNFIPYKYHCIDWENLSELRGDIEKFEEYYDQLLLLPLQQRVNAIFSDMQFQSISDHDDQFRFNPLTVRILYPPQAEITQHCENESVHKCPRFFELLKVKINVWDLFSLVLMLNPPEAGGEIIIYNQCWTDLVEMEEQRANLIALDDSSTSTHIRAKVKLEKGDVLIFQAGKTWHKVDRVTGTAPRITAGCFFGKAQNDKGTFRFWS